MNKGLFLSFAMLVFGSFWCCAASETFVTVGGRYTVINESANNGIISSTSTMNSIDILLDSYTFWDKANVGFFIHDGFLFPTTGSLTLNGITSSVDFSIYDLLIGVGIIVGPGFRIPIGGHITALLGIGLNVIQLAGYYNKYVAGVGTISYSILAWMIGVGGDIGLKLDLTDRLFFKLGSSFAYDFASYSIVNLNGSSASGWASHYSSFVASPYIGIGFTFF